MEATLLGWRPILVVTRSYQVEAIAIRLEAMTSSNKKLLVGLNAKEVKRNREPMFDEARQHWEPGVLLGPLGRPACKREVEQAAFSDRCHYVLQCICDSFLGCRVALFG